MIVLRHANSPARHRRSRGFTLAEVMVALLVFAISVVGLVAMESRSIESQKASAELREAERVAQEWMTDLQSRSFLDLLARDFDQVPAVFPYEDNPISIRARVVDFRRPPADADPTLPAPGAIPGKFVVHRRIDLVGDPLAPPANPPMLPDDLVNVQGLMLQVAVLWIDDTNPAYPIPEVLPGGGIPIAANLEPSMVDPTHPNYAPFVGSVVLRTVRANDVPHL